jgi:hypothetical protein
MRINIAGKLALRLDPSFLRRGLHGVTKTAYAAKQVDKPNHPPPSYTFSYSISPRTLLPNVVRSADRLSGAIDCVFF